MIGKLLTKHHLEFLSLNGRCRGSSESTLVKMSNCWKSHAAAHYKMDMKTHSFNIIISPSIENIWYIPEPSLILLNI